MKKLAMGIVLCCSFQFYVANAFAQYTSYQLCKGIVENHLVESSGLVSIRLLPSPPYNYSRSFSTLCNLGQHYEGVSPETCTAWLEMFTESQRSESVLSFVFYDNPVDTYCFDDRNPWRSSPIPSFIMAN